MAENEPIFNFMYVRPALALDEHAARRDYIRDLHERVAATTEMTPSRDVAPDSTVSQTVATLVFSDVNPDEGLALLKQELLALLLTVAPTFDLEGYPYLQDNGNLYLLPARLDMLTSLPLLSQAQAIVEALGKGSPPKAADLAKKLVELSDKQPLQELVFSDTGHSSAYVASNRELFDTLYLLYILRRWASVDLDPVMRGIRALHVLEALAVDELVNAAIDGSIDQSGLTKLGVASRYFPELVDWDRKGATKELPLIADQAALAAYWNATPVIHPIFARLFRYMRPFNDIKPLGVGDLKVVKQKLLKYEAGEISDIHNVMKGESNVRAHRRLEKTEELFSFSGSSEQETQRDSQSTDRSEIKREAENVIKTEISGSAGASVTYNQNPVMATVSAGFAASRSGQAAEKSANNFSKEVIAKALDRVIKRTSEQRSTTKIFETEERNRHALSNTKGNEHVNGIYQWVDKRYRAQVYNFGKRMMFEFLVPEPASFMVEQRLRGFEAALQMPIKPKREKDGEVELPFEPEQIDEAMFRDLKAQYGLDDELEFPPREIRTQVLDAQTGDQLIKGSNLPDNQLLSFPGKLSIPGVAGYDLDWIAITGNIDYGVSITGDAAPDRLVVRVNGTLIFQDDATVRYVSYPATYSTDLNGLTVGISQNNPVISVEVSDAAAFQLALSVRLTLSAAGLLNWQRKVRAAVARVEQTKVDAANKEKQLAFESAMTTYNNRLDEIRAVAVNDLLQGKSEAYNRAMMIRELKRACISLIAKEFDADESDDLLTEWEMMGEFDVLSKTTRMNVDRSGDPATASFDTTWEDLIFPAMDIPSARGKARFIQFLEQAFEWQQLGWVCYPYFWTPPPKWVQLMSREDQTDQSLTDFLQAGAAKVLLAVSPEYDDAVLHFLATREPWEGGDAPALGDPLYLPLYEEMHKAQDDTYGGKPVGAPWEFTVPTSLIYLRGSKDTLPDFTGANPERRRAVTVLVNYDAVPPLASGSQPLAGGWPGDPTTRSARLALRLQRAYIERVQEYQREFEWAERIDLIEDTRRVESGYPRIGLLLDGVRSEFSIDETLYQSLFDLYTFYGWNGVRWAQSALQLLHHERARDATAEVSWRFFMYTRNLLGVLIRETLIELEERAAQIVFDRLGGVHRKLSAALMGELAFTYKPATRVPSQGVKERFDYIPDQYLMKNKPTATALYELLTKAVERRDAYDRLVGEQSRLGQLQKEAADAAVKETAPGWRSPSSGDDRAADRMKRIDVELHAMSGPVEAALGALQAAQKDVVAKSPFALILVPGLPTGFSKEHMEDALGRMLTNVDKGIDEIAMATRPGDSRVARHLPGLPSEWQNDTTGARKLDPRTVERLYSPGLILEFHLAEAAARDADSDPAISWLLESRSWQLVMAGGTVEPGSFEHIVLFHWLEGLETFQSETAKSRFGFSHKLGVAAAALSLITLVFPPLAVLNVVAAAALLADAAHTAAQRLAEVDNAIAAQLPALDEPGQVALAEYGSLLAMRPRLVTEIAGDFLLLLATMGAAQRIHSLRVALGWKGYVDDVSTLIHASDRV